MRTYPQIDGASGLTVAFDIENVYVSPSTVGRVLSGIDGVSEVSIRRLFSKSPDIHVRFKYRGRDCIVWEMYGDNSMFWIGPEDMTQPIDFRLVEDGFKRYIVAIHRRLLGDILSLPFFRGRE